MATVPAPAGKPAARPHRAAAGSLKRDINLLPANESSEKIARNGTIILAVVVGLLIVGYFAIILPSTILHGLQAQADAAQNEKAALAGADQEFGDRVAQRNALKEMIDSLNLTVKDYLQPADLFRQLSSACPGSITLTAVTQDGSGLTLDGTAPDDDAVAQFIVNLRTIDVFDRVVFVSAQDNENDVSGAQPRMFEVKCLLPAPTAAPSPIPAATAAAEGGAGQ